MECDLVKQYGYIKITDSGPDWFLDGLWFKDWLLWITFGNNRASQMFGFVWREGLYDICKEERSVETVSIGETKKKVGWEQLLKSKGNKIESIQIVMVVQCKPVIPELGRWRQEKLKFVCSLTCVSSSKVVWGTQWNPLARKTFKIDVDLCECIF